MNGDGYALEYVRDIDNRKVGNHTSHYHRFLLTIPNEVPEFLASEKFCVTFAPSVDPMSRQVVLYVCVVIVTNAFTPFPSSRFMEFPRGASWLLRCTPRTIEFMVVDFMCYKGD